MFGSHSQHIISLLVRLITETHPDLSAVDPLDLHPRDSVEISVFDNGTVGDMDPF